MNSLLEILKYVLPALVVLATAYYLLRLFFENEQKKRDKDIKMAGYKLVTPIRLQAYERLVLFLERISPESLVMRVHQSDLTVIQLQTMMLKTVREEFEHNLSQQVYISSKAWELIRTAREEIIKLVNTAAAKVNENATSTHLCQKIFELSLSENQSVNKKALEFLKNEIREVF